MNNKFLLIIIGLLALLLLGVAYCSRPNVPEITPTLSISATPSDTPAPPTATATPTTVAPVAVSPLPAQGTAVAPSPPPTAVPNTSTPPRLVMPTVTATAKPAIAPTATDEALLIVPGTTYWHTAKAKYGRPEAWQCLKARNGWHEYRLPVGETMRLPGTC